MNVESDIYYTRIDPMRKYERNFGFGKQFRSSCEKFRSQYKVRFRFDVTLFHVETGVNT